MPAVILGRMLRSLLALMCALAVIASVAIAPAAVAQEDGVTVDPGSPSGKEYALPIDRARAQAAKGGSGSDAQKAPLFGEGVDGDGAGPTAGRGGSAADRGSSAGGRGSSRDRAGGTRGAASPMDDLESGGSGSSDDSASANDRRLLRAQAAEGGLGIGASIGAGIGILLIGGLIGLWLRRRATP